MDGTRNGLKEWILKRIRQSKLHAISFAEFMEMALYHPQGGYYQQSRPKLGKEGDYFTNVHVSDLFGRVLARFFIQLWEKSFGGHPLVLVEFGGGDGRLAEQICQEFVFQKFPENRVYWYFIEKSTYHQSLQKERLASFPYSLEWKSALEEVPTAPFAIVYSNELLDAFPIHRIVKKHGELYEIFVTEDQGELLETIVPLSNSKIAQYLEQFAVDLREGQVLEIHLQAKRWLKSVAEWLNQGWILTIDYGGTMQELLSEERQKGTLRGFCRHQLTWDWYDRPGEIDLTSHVPFEALIRWGEEFGLKKEFYGTQARFLIEAGILDFYPSSAASDPFSPEGKRIRAIQQLLYGMGEAFQVLLQAK
jgi:SAM-dependent MidA family methyltransferase